ncbi:MULTISPECIES: gamma carbonic anhydrase family protein [Burkholderiaceae]|uniref:Gamma carbonic anhydrase family protein n=2 Tax=Burkholderiaceae TaxID=119060 RepID=A0A643G570_9BURK|nr:MULTISPECIES: gamma carbonic anhydrase family protein [Burkholderiaceae]KUE86474.1 anhydrase [Cupriavidus necator]NOV23687.1 gamma carbonic anhydrase family protein [Cupriavidus necator]OXI30999.1 gamma carbonic anhydrase family protein [Burkholderia aenigmatica]QOT81748.1 gamma carbonic anhydrase family protein [Cupriavidus basilensis]BDB30409.1 gamma carbonic anhydrase family protein [Cupriavidus sp. P-10]
MAIYRIGEKEPTIHPSSYVSEHAVIIGDVEIAEDVSIWPGAVIRGDNEKITIRRGVNVQEGAVLHTDPGFPVEVGEMVSIGHQAMLHGCKVGARSLVGIQAVILNGSELGQQCLVGAGSLIGERKNFPAGSLVMGTPAKQVRELTEEVKAAIEKNADDYINKAKTYKKDLVKLS